jgi:UDP-3-O-[3-hydroxymyristoyl] glucosamine N-acyltransferase
MDIAILDVAVMGVSKGSEVLQTIAKEVGYTVKYLVDDFAEGAMRPEELPVNFPLVIGMFDNNRRLELGKKYNALTLIHPTAYIAPTAKIGKGTVIKQRASIGNNVVIGDMCVIDSGVVIEHDSIIHDGAQVTVGSVTGGFVEVGKASVVGLNCTLQTYVKIGKDCVICSGTTVLSDVPDGTRVKSGRVWITGEPTYDVHS